jgi:chromosome segregation ATPase
MVTMPDTTSTAKPPHEVAGDRLIEIAQKKAPAAASKATADDTSLTETKKPRAGLLQSLGKLKPLLPILSSGLRMVDHSAVQALAQLLNFASGNSPAQSAAQEELHQGLAEIQASHRDLNLRVQDQTVEMRRIEDQITLLRQSVERNATEHTELVEDVKSLSNLVRIIGAGLAILLVILITLTVLLSHHH